MFDSRANLLFLTIVSFLLSQDALSQTIHYALNDDGEHEVGVQSTPAEGCRSPFFGRGGSLTTASIGDEWQTEEFQFTHFAIFSFDMEGWVAGDTYRLFLSERQREGTPFADLGKMLVEYADQSQRFPGRFGDTMTLLTSLTADQLFSGEGIDIGTPINQILSGPHGRYLYLRLRFQNCSDGDQETERTSLQTGGSSNPDAAIRIVQGTTVKKLFFTQFGDGAEGGASLFSQLVLVVLDPSKAANVTVLLKNPDGSPMTVDLNGVEVVGETQLLIPVGGIRILATDGVGKLQRGSVTVTSDVPLSGVVLFGGSVGFAGVASSVPLTKVVTPIQAATPGVNTGIAMMGLGVPQLLQLELFDAEGQSAGKTEFELVTGEEQDARFVDQFAWDKAVDFTDFTGSLVICGESEFGAVSILLRPGQFATLPVSEKPAVTP